MSLIINLIVAVAVLFAPAQSDVPAPVVPTASAEFEADAVASLEVRVAEGLTAQELRLNCTTDQLVYVNSGEHGTTLTDQFSVWSITNENVFHHFACK